MPRTVTLKKITPVTTKRPSRTSSVGDIGVIATFDMKKVDEIADAIDKIPEEIDKMYRDISRDMRLVITDNLKFVADYKTYSSPGNAPYRHSTQANRDIRRMIHVRRRTIKKRNGQTEVGFELQLSNPAVLKHEQGLTVTNTNRDRALYEKKEHGLLLLRPEEVERAERGLNPFKGSMFAGRRQSPGPRRKHPWRVVSSGNKTIFDPIDLIRIMAYRTIARTRNMYGRIVHIARLKTSGATNELLGRCSQDADYSVGKMRYRASYPKRPIMGNRKTTMRMNREYSRAVNRNLEKYLKQIE